MRLPVTTRVCSDCGNPWSLELGRNAIRLGPEHGLCSACGEWVETGFREWPSLSAHERRRFRWRWVPSLALAWVICLGTGIRMVRGRRDDWAVDGLTTALCGGAALVLLIGRAGAIRESIARSDAERARYGKMIVRYASRIAREE